MEFENMVYFQNMTEEEFDKFRRIIYDEIGINILSHKKIMLQGRIRKRLKKLGISTYSEYYDFILDDRDELLQMFNVVSTNKTEFFRERHHFDFFEEVIPVLMEENIRNREKKISVWSSASSTGQEPYSIAMTLMEYPALKTWSVKIIGSDISTDVLEKAIKGIYSYEDMKSLPKEFLKYFKKTENPNFFEVSDEIKNMVKFKRINLTADEYPFKGEFEVIFCRNVLIYFDRETQSKVILNLLKYLRKDGYIILGSSESMPKEFIEKNMVKRMKSTIYQKL